MPNTPRRNQQASNASPSINTWTAVDVPGDVMRTERASAPTFSDAVDRLAAIHARLEDQVKSLGHLGNCYLGSCPEDEATESGLRFQPDGAVNVLASQIGHIEYLISALEGKIDRFRGRH